MMKYLSLVIMGVGLLPVLAWPMIWYLSIFAFDAPGSTTSLSAWGSVLVANAIPLACLGAGYLAWGWRKQGRHWRAVGISAIPAVLVAVGVAIVLEPSFNRHLDGLTDEDQKFLRRVHSGNVKRVGVQVGAGRKLDFYSSTGMTPLAAAYEGQSLEVFELLLDSGADPDYWVPGVFAPEREHIAFYILYDLIENSRNQGPEFLEALLKRGLDPNLRSRRFGQPLLASAVTVFVPDYIVLLLDWGADVNQRTTHGETPLQVCADRRIWANCFLLLPHDVTTDRRALTDSIHAAHKKNEEFMGTEIAPSDEMLAFLEAITPSDEAAIEFWQ